MTTVAVTGATGTLGRPLVAALAAAGHQVRAVSRHPDDGVRGDVLDPASIAAALEGVDTVVHAATSPRRGTRRTEVEGTRNVVAAVEQSGARLVYVSIVGVDVHRFPYYRAKREAEQLVEAMPGPWAIQRATQFHELIDMVLGSPFFVRTPRLAFQPCAAADVASRLAEVVGSGATGRQADFGGPEVLGIRELARLRRDARGKAARLVRAPAVGWLGDFDAGLHLARDHADGVVTWERWLSSRREGELPSPRTPER